MAATTSIKLKPVVRFREFPFGTVSDPSMREFMAAAPWNEQDRVLEYQRSGRLVAYPTGADLTDWFDRPNNANPSIEGRPVGGVTPMTDGVWYWPAGLIHFIEVYNVTLPREFVDQARRNNWRVEKERVAESSYDFEF